MTEVANSEAVEVQELTVAEAGSPGVISIHDDVISMIAHETARNVPGVVELSGSLADGIANMIGKREKGIRVEKASENVRSIDLTVVLEYGVCIPEICSQLQTSVKKAVEDMTGQSIYAVNVFVSGVRCPKVATEG